MSQFKLLINVALSTGRRRILYQKLRRFSINTADVSTNDDHQNILDSSIIYNSCLSNLYFLERRGIIKLPKTVVKAKEDRPLPVSLKYLKSEENENSRANFVSPEEPPKSVNFPYSLKVCTEENFRNFEDTAISDETATAVVIEESQSMVEMNDAFQFLKSGKSWMNDYEQYTQEDEESNFEEWRYNYGTADSKIPVSDVSCGGCGAFLHCQDPAIPGYLPSEIFLRCNKKDLLKITCQRCHFLKNYNTFLAISVDKTIYPKLLAKIKEKDALVLLMVDLTDFPCSIWPGILDIIGKDRPLFIVGNKVDLLWGDCKTWMDNVKKILRSSFPSNANILHVGLISAKTGFGVEQLINKLHLLWRYKGDVYLIGCTNVGKSTLFNALLQSDYCKVKAADLMQRATTSPWPGTTLNLLKFPILRPEGWRLYLRTLRLINEQKKSNYENKVKIELMKATKMNKSTPIQLIGHIGRTFTNKPNNEEVHNVDNFTVPNKNHLAKVHILGSGIDPKDPDFAKSKWFYDTPGVLHTDQILDLLTTEELMMTIPKNLVRPRTFLVKPGWTLFIAGLARLDFIEGDKPIRLTVFSSLKLPITICDGENADNVYSNLLGSKYMLVPSGSDNRLKEWPNLQKSNDIILLGIGPLTSCADIVLSSAGWISVTADVKQICKFIAWTPQGRGVHVRIPSLLPNAVNLRGKKISRSPAYERSTPFKL